MTDSPDSLQSEQLSDFFASTETEDQARDLLADIIDAYMSEGGEFRAYDLVDRIHRRLNESAWWLVPAENLKGLISEVDALTTRLALAQAVVEAAERRFNCPQTVRIANGWERIYNEAVIQFRASLAALRESETE